MAEKTFTVQGGYKDRNGRFMHFLKGVERPVEADAALPEGVSVRVIGGKAVKAQPSR